MKITRRAGLGLVSVLLASILSQSRHSIPHYSRGEQRGSDVYSVESLRTALRHELGFVLCDGTPLGDTFSITNHTGRELHFTSGVAHRPCCSSINGLPLALRPGQSGSVTAYLSTRDRSGPVRADFTLWTDDDKALGLRLSVAANLVQEFEIPSNPVQPEPVVGRSSDLSMTLIQRRLKSRSGATPAVVADPPLSILRDEPTGQRGLPGGLVESSRKIVLKLPRVERPGRAYGVVRLRRPDGREQSHPISWIVRPCLEVIPSGLVLGRSEETLRRIVVVRSHDQPFRVTGVSGDLVNGYRILSGAGTPEQRIEIGFEPSRPAQASATIEIATDHPRLPTAVLSVVIPR